MVTTLKYCPVRVSDMLAEAHDPRSNARRSPVRGAWFVERLGNQVASDREAIAFLQRHGLDDDAIAISQKWMRVHQCEAAIVQLAKVGE